MLYSNQLLAISENKRCGLILCKAYHADFVGPGAAVGGPIEQGYNVVIAIGSPDFATITSYEDRQRAYSRRIQWMRWLQKITDYPDPTLRAEKLLSGFEAFFGAQIVASIPDDVLALLIGVLPKTMQTVRFQYYNLTHGGGRLPKLEGEKAYALVASQSVFRGMRADSHYGFDTLSPCLSIYNFSGSLPTLPQSA